MQIAYKIYPFSCAKLSKSIRWRRFIKNYNEWTFYYGIFCVFCMYEFGSSSIRTYTCKKKTLNVHLVDRTPIIMRGSCTLILLFFIYVCGVPLFLIITFLSLGRPHLAKYAFLYWTNFLRSNFRLTTTITRFVLGEKINSYFLL